MYCNQCGHPVDLNGNFCAKCGHKVDQVTATSPQPEQNVKEEDQTMATTNPVQEPVKWVLSAQHKLSLLKMIPCNVVFMQDKVILAHLTSEMQKSESAKLSQELKSEGIGFFKGSAAMIKFWANYNKKYYAMSADQILSEDSSNVALPYQSINKVVFQCDSPSTDSDDNGTQGKIQFDLNNGEVFKFSHSQGNYRSIKEILENLFGDSLKYKK